MKVPDSRPGRTRMVSHPGPIADARAERRRLMAQGRPDVAEVAPETLTEFFGQWMRASQRTLAPSTLYTYDEAFRLRIGPALGQMYLPELTHERVVGFVNELAATASSTRIVAKTLTCLSSCMSAAVAWGRIPINPCSHVRADRVRVDADGDHFAGEHERRVLSAAELQRLYDANPNPRVSSMLRTAAEAALRRGELIGLKWPDIDFERNRIHVRRSVWQERMKGGRKIEKACKGREARTVPIGEPLTRLLGDWYAISVVEGGASASGYVWPGKDLGAMGADTPSQATERALIRAGLTNELGKPLVTLHSLRHGCGSLMLMAGTPLIAVSRFLGHANVQITAERYSHLVSSEEQLRGASDALNALMTTDTVRETVRETPMDRENPFV